MMVLLVQWFVVASHTWSSHLVRNAHQWVVR